MNKKAVFGGVVVVVIILAVGLGVGLSSTNKDNAPPQAKEIIVDIPGQGRVRGGLATTDWTHEKFMQFLSIPYAESPSGELRYKSPVPRSPWSHIHDGTKFGLACPSMGRGGPKSATATYAEEDCLNLSVYTKSLTGNSPVIFCIVGGGFIHSDGSEFHGELMLNEDVVFVVVQYRTGALGFASSNTPEIPGNMALDDVILALQWVQNNIHHFGGNKNLVTMFGESAGGWMTSALLISPKTENTNYFHRVIITSGQILSRYKLDNDPIEQTKRFCRNLQCTHCEEYSQMYQCLMTRNLDDLRDQTANEKFEPTIETQLEILPQHPIMLLDHYNRSIPIMTGFQRHDGTLPFTEFYGNMKVKYGNLNQVTVRQFAQDFISSSLSDYSGVSNDVLMRLMFDKTPGLLDSTDHHKAIPAYFDITSMIFLKSPILNFARKMAAKRVGANRMTNVFLYANDYATHDPIYDRPGSLPWQNTVNHGMYNLILFKLGSDLGPQDTLMSKQLISLWTSFAATGIPKDTANIPLSSFTSPSGPINHLNLKITTGFNSLKELTTNIDDPNQSNIIREDIPF